MHRDLSQAAVHALVNGSAVIQPTTIEANTSALVSRSKRAGQQLSATEALAHVRSGMRVFIGSGCGAPQKLVQALAARGPQVYDVEIIHILTFGAAPYASRERLENFRHNAFFIGPNVREAVNEGLADVTPV